LEDKTFRSLRKHEWQKERSKYRETTSEVMVFPALELRFIVYELKLTPIKKDFNNSSAFLYIKPSKPNA
jgi:zona occludens toxin (predicted ATPase)